jgi:hypothetical protein
MQVQTLQIYSTSGSPPNSNGSWIDVSNLVAISVQINNYVAASTDIEVSNDPNVMIDGSGIGAPGAAPVLSQFLSTPGSLSTPPGNVDTSTLPPQTFYVKTTFITKWGETTASPESSLSVLAGNYLFVAAPVPSAAQQPYVTGWNCYVGLSSGKEVLQTAPQYNPQRLIDGIGTVGGTVNPLGPNQSTRFAISGALPLITNVIGSVVKVQGQNFSMVNGFQQTQWTPPSSDQSGGTGSGVSVSNGAGLSTLTSNTNTAVAVFISGGNLIWSSSNMTWKFLRVTHGGASTVAYLEGLRG